MRLLPALPALLLAAACAAPGPRETPAAPPPNIFDPPASADPQDDAVVAFIDEQPVRWRDVVDRAMSARGKELIDQYILWKLRRERIQELGIRNTPEELRNRAKVGLEAKRAQVGDEDLKKWLAAQKLTEAEVIERLAQNPEFDESVKNEKAAAYTMLTEASIEIDAIAFTDPQEAASFATLVGRLSFGEAAERLAMTPNLQGKAAHWPRHRFPRGLAPDAIAASPELERKLFAMNKGQTTGVERAGGGILVIINVVDAHPADPAPYAKIADRVMADVLRQPPSPEQIRLWIERLPQSKRIRYEDRYTPGNKGR
ncbi:MAG TPA: peptidylprolyl isomerase [Planctomycetota bacterium]